MCTGEMQVEKVEDGNPGLYRVTALMNDGSEIVDDYNTVSLLVVIVIRATVYTQHSVVVDTDVPR